ncbi:hypothetical protein Scep_017827 [Stephania cephalantha]|uniref:UBA domain-containing protein n=1 Tax=Stephania cephalantha TaxID=152367 RepID=A0AAP0IQA9_9MAGN
MGMGFSRDAVAKAIEENGEGNLNAILDSLTQAASSSASPSNSQLVSNFMGMEFSRDAVAKAIEENGNKRGKIIMQNFISNIPSL